MNADALEVSLIIRDQRRGLCAIAEHVTGHREDWTLETLPGKVKDLAEKAALTDEMAKALRALLALEASFPACAEHEQYEPVCYECTEAADYVRRCREVHATAEGVVAKYEAGRGA